MVKAGGLTFPQKGLSGDLDDSAQIAMFHDAFGQRTPSEVRQSPREP